MNPDFEPTLNRRVIARLQAKSRRLRNWIWFFILLMPVGLIVPAVIAIAFLKGTPATVFGIAAFVLPIIGLAGVMLMVGDLEKVNEPLAVAQLGQDIGFVYRDDAPEEDMIRLSSLQSLARSEEVFGSLSLFGQMNGFHASILEYVQRNWSAGQANDEAHTMFLFPDSVPGIPGFFVFSRGWTSKLTWLIGSRNTIELDGEDEFNRQFRLDGDDPDQVDSLFSAEIVELCLEEPNLNIEVCDGLLVLYEFRRVIKPRDYKFFLSWGLRWVTALRKSGEANLPLIR